MRKLFIVAVTTVLLASMCGLSLAGDEQQEENKEPSFWMKQKLSYAQNILNGLVTEDFDAIQENATAMKSLNRVERFVRRKPEGYRTQLKIFQFSVDELIRHSEADNLDGATLAFTQMTTSCVNCHKQLRKQ